eukprot:COSAG02_NODE_59453_length_274_cov_0.645714_1_plen_73_part_00
MERQRFGGVWFGMKSSGKSRRDSSDNSETVCLVSTVHVQSIQLYILVPLIGTVGILVLLDLVQPCTVHLSTV